MKHIAYILFGALLGSVGTLLVKRITREDIFSGNFIWYSDGRDEVTSLSRIIYHFDNCTHLMARIGYNGLKLIELRFIYKDAKMAYAVSMPEHDYKEYMKEFREISEAWENKEHSVMCVKYIRK